jgi:hypothetical protein
MVARTAWRDRSDINQRLSTLAISHGRADPLSLCACGHFNAFGLEVRPLRKAGVHAEIHRVLVLVARRLLQFGTEVDCIFWNVWSCHYFLPLFLALDFVLRGLVAFNGWSCAEGASRNGMVETFFM